MSVTFPAPPRPARRSLRDVEVKPVLDELNELLGYRLHTTDGTRQSRLYLSREDALDAWINRCIEWET